MEQKRFVGIDLGKRTFEIKFITSNGSVTGSNGKTCPSGRRELYKKLLPTDRIAIEVCSLGMVMAKEIIQQVGAEVVLLNPSQIALIYRSVKMNDKEEALKLARLVQKFTNIEKYFLNCFIVLTQLLYQFYTYLLVLEQLLLVYIVDIKNTT